jgi:hypothetical protein
MGMAEEYGWLIEAFESWAGRPQWVRVVRDVGRGYLGWTTDASEALRFARHKDAVDFALLHPDIAVLSKVTDHIWTAPFESPRCVLCNQPAELHPNAGCQTFVGTSTSKSGGSGNG